ncbi:MAG: histidine--tRNA ligase [Deltaproteobacteria bacterium]|nr:MAG: histidine--tRNA ligase [Deltaproteobacteria bacterium]
MSKVSTPKGTRDFSPAEVIKRQYLFDTIRKSFQKFGFMPLETPSMENLSVLTGKYGEEGDRLIFKILNSGDYLNKIDEKILVNKEVKALTPKISEKALRYDLTVPFARYVVQHQNDIVFPFKRYQIQPVWRAERPQKGRYREFFQCDADVVGTESLLCEVELMQIYEEAFKALNLDGIAIKINNRKILTGMAEVIGEKDRIIDMTIAIDKLDKIGKDKVLEELKGKNFSDDSLKKLDPLFGLSGNSEEQLTFMKTYLKDSEIGLKGIEELETVMNLCKEVGLELLEFEVTLARGLDYYTGAIFEVKVNDGSMGSIGAGGRYDNLTEIFGLKDVSGVGISFGADRIYDLLEMRDLFPKDIAQTTKALIINFGSETLSSNLKVVKELRDNGIPTEIYPSDAKMKKQMKYADGKSIPYVILQGTDEASQGKATLKNMATGEQKLVDVKDLPSLIR